MLEKNNDVLSIYISIFGKLLFVDLNFCFITLQWEAISENC